MIRLDNIGRNTGLSEKIPAKFGDTCSVKADWLCMCIGCLGQWEEGGKIQTCMNFFARPCTGPGAVLLTCPEIIVSEGNSQLAESY